MAETLTDGSVFLQDVAEAGGVRIRVRTPGMQFRWSTFEQPPTFEAVEPGEEPGGWNEAIADNELEELTALQTEAVAMLSLEAADAEAVPFLAAPDSEDVFVDVQADPLPGESLLVMVENDGVMQWFAPTNAADVLTPPAAILGVAEEAAAPRPSLQFSIPRSTLANTGPALEGIGVANVGRAIVRFFRVKLIPAILERPLEWLIEKVEKRAKPREGFRFFDRDRDYPFCTQAELSAMAGQRVLLLTHGIFSSLAGAFDGIADANGTTLQRLRTIYGNNIIGWDHWTVGKTPLENAKEMLAALPPNVRPDLVCHSRGGLVTRAMLEHPQLITLRQSRFTTVGTNVFVAGACQGSQLATLHNVNRLLNLYSAIASFPFLGGAGVVLKIIVGVLKVLAHGVARLDSIQALSADVANNPFLQELNDSPLTPTGKIVVLHANYDPASGPLARFLDFNVDIVFGQANDMVVPFTGAETFDQWQKVGPNFQYGTATVKQSVVMHTNFFHQPSVHSILEQELQ